MNEKRNVDLLLVIFWLNSLVVVFLLFLAILQIDGSINIGLFVPSFLVVTGSFAIYLLQRYHHRERLKSALVEEIDGLEEVSKLAARLESLDASRTPPNDLIPSDKISPAESFQTVVYEQNASELGRLPQEEVKDVVRFYSRLNQVRAIISKIRRIEERRQQKEIEKNGESILMSNTEMSFHELLLREVSTLDTDRDRVIKTLND